MEKIYKYLIDNKDRYIHEHTFEMPYEPKILSCTEQNGKIAIYALVNVARVIEMSQLIEFRVIGTGVSVPGDNYQFTFLGTVKIGGLVWHVFYKG